MDFIDYRKKLGIGLNDSELENLFFNRIFNALDSLWNMHDQISDEEYYTFCQITGYPMNQGITSGSEWGAIMKILHSNAKTIREFLPYYMFFINCQTDEEYKPWKKEDFKTLVCKFLIESHIPYELFEDNGEYFVFPKGAKELDDALVSQPLEWLKSYPKSHTAFVKALKLYSEATENTASDVADFFRKSLETFFQEFFNSTKSLENLKSDYGTYMKSRGVPAEISNNLEALQQAYTNYMNNYAKHHDKTSINVLEYIMYQTGNIIRLLITLSEEDK